MDGMDSQREHIHPRIHEAEARKVQAMVEVAPMRGAQREAVDWIFLLLAAAALRHWIVGKPLSFSRWIEGGQWVC
jgi:hypothetical protein